MVALSTIVLAFHAVTIFCFGVFLVTLTTEFNWGRGALSGTLSISLILSGGLGIIAGRLSDKYGPRRLVTVSGVLTGISFLLLSRINALWQVYLIWGIPLAMAGSALSIPLISTIPRWFTKSRGVAIGIVSAGFSLGGIGMPLLAQWLISGYGWRQAYVFLAIIYTMIVIPLAQFMKHSPQRAGLKPYRESENIKVEYMASGGEGFTVSQAVKTWRFWVLMATLFCFQFALQTILAHVVAHAIDIRISAAVAASLLSVVAGAGAIGKFSMGIISDKIGCRLALAASLGTITLALIWLIFSTNTAMLFIFAAIFGYAYGCVVTLQNLLPAELFGLKFLGIILAAVLFGGSVGGAVGPLISGIIFDSTGSYRAAFLIAATICAVALTLSLLLLRTAPKGAALTSKS